MICRRARSGVDVDDNFAPTYLVPRDKTKLIKELKESVQKAREVYLATDPDREGEAIAWHLIQATGAAAKPVHRVVFHEITPEAVSEAMASPRGIDPDLVDAQQARRVLDRLVGYKVSPLLWKKVKRGLSAGRVQTAALRIVVEREREIEAFEPVEYWSIDAELAKQTGAEPRPRDIFRAGLQRVQGKKITLDNAEQTEAVLAALDGAHYRVADVTRKEVQRRPSPPFTTSTCSRRLRARSDSAFAARCRSRRSSTRASISAPQGTQGLITYMRTDSTNVASSAQFAARDEIARRYGPEYVPERPPVYTRKAKGAQEAHEAIRPTAPHRDPASVKPFLSTPAVPAVSAHLAAVHRLADASGHPRPDRGRRRGRARRGDLATGRPALPVPGDRVGCEVPRVHGRLPGGPG